MGVGLTHALISSNIIKMWQVVNYVVDNQLRYNVSSCSREYGNGLESNRR